MQSVNELKTKENPLFGWSCQSAGSGPSSGLSMTGRYSSITHSPAKEWKKHSISVPGDTHLNEKTFQLELPTGMKNFNKQFPC
jgi:hypothetical protein